MCVVVIASWQQRAGAGLIEWNLRWMVHANKGIIIERPPRVGRQAASGAAAWLALRTRAGCARAAEFLLADDPCFVSGA